MCKYIISGPCSMVTTQRSANSVSKGNSPFDIQMMYEDLLEAGTEQKKALSYRLLTEETLVDCINEGKRGEKLKVRLVAKLEELVVSLKVGDEDRDIFTLPRTEDSFSRQVFQNILKNF